MALPIKLPLDLMQTKWSAELNPVLANPITSGNLLQGIAIVTGKNVINHGLGAKLQGYIIVLNSAAVTFHDTQSTNPMTNLTLDLIASGPTTISIYCF